MKSAKLSKEEKTAELKKYRDLVMATLDYGVGDKAEIKIADFDLSEHFRNLKTQAEEHFVKGRLTRLKQWFRDLAEMYVETKDLRFNKYLQDKTGYDIDIFKTYFERVEKVVAEGRITTDNQFYDIQLMVDQLCQTDPVDDKNIAVLNKLLSYYEQKKSRRIKN